MENPVWIHVLTAPRLRGGANPIRRDYLLLGFVGELVFDQGLGDDLFVARVAGNGATGTLTEGLYYGSSILSALLLFVLCHSDCAQ